MKRRWFMAEPLAAVRVSCGRAYLSIGGMIIAVEGDPCRDSTLVGNFAPRNLGDTPPPSLTIPPSIDYVVDRYIPYSVRHVWSPGMLEAVAHRINACLRGE
jgi:hypothetical protein